MSHRELQRKRGWKESFSFRRDMVPITSAISIRKASKTDSTAVACPTPSSGVAVSVTPKPSLWALAFGCLQRDKPELANHFLLDIGIGATCGERNDNLSAGLDTISQRAFQELRKISESQDELGRTNATIRKTFEQTVKIIIASKDAVSLAVSANPYAALAWTGVSLLLPLLLNPSQENEAAIKGLDRITNIISVYKWQEQNYLQDSNATSDLEDSVVQLYTLVLEYEATLLMHKSKNLSRRWANNVFKAGTWLDLLTRVQDQDHNCQNIAQAFANARAKAWREEERKWQRELLRQPRQEEEKNHLRLLYSNYEAAKNVNPERIPGTCHWLVNHNSFLAWRESHDSRLLWVSADPGCGKSVLSKHLVDRKGEALTVLTAPPTLCYFFFKDGDVERMDAAKAVCAFLHQLILQHPQLYQHAREDFDTKSKEFLADFDALWDVFLATSEDPALQEIVCVLDALDECREKSRLVAKITKLYNDLRAGSREGPVLKFFVTSRPDFSIVRDFMALTDTMSEVRLRGEEESEQISREIDLVIKFKVEQLEKKLSLRRKEKEELLANLSKVSQRTYLWLYLTFDDIERQLEITKDEIAVIAKTIPEDVDKAYTRILDKSPNKERARKLLHIVLAAQRPLSIEEMNVALVMSEEIKCYADLESYLWRPDLVEDTIKNVCGLFVTVVEKKVYLIHQTAREFLLGEDDAHPGPSSEVRSAQMWRKSFYARQGHLVMARTCVYYLCTQDLPVQEPRGPATEIGAYELEAIGQAHVFLSYAAMHWSDHSREAHSLIDDSLAGGIAFTMCNPHCAPFRLWSTIHCFLFGRFATWLSESALLSNLSVSALLGIESAVKLLLKQPDVALDFADSVGRTPLHIMANIGWTALAILLLERDESLANIRDCVELSPLIYAVLANHPDFVQMLVERRNVDVNLRNRRRCTPLHYAALQESEMMVRMLLKRQDLQIDPRDCAEETPLYFAARAGCETIVRLLLERGAQPDVEDCEGFTPIDMAEFYGHVNVVKLLEERGMRVNVGKVNKRKAIDLQGRDT